MLSEVALVGNEPDRCNQYKASFKDMHKRTSPIIYKEKSKLARTYGKGGGSAEGRYGQKIIMVLGRSQVGPGPQM
jgi:hypothetical protein